MNRVAGLLWLVIGSGVAAEVAAAGSIPEAPSGDGGVARVPGQLGRWIIPPGCDDRIREFLLPLRLGGKTTSGHVFQDVTVIYDRLRLTFERDGQTSHIELHHPHAADGAAVGAIVKAEPGVPAELVAEVRSAVARAKPVSPWVRNPFLQSPRPGGEAPDPPSPAGAASPAETPASAPATREPSEQWPSWATPAALGGLAVLAALAVFFAWRRRASRTPPP